MLAADPHGGLNSPSTFYPIHRVARNDGFDVSGDSAAGAPYVAFGRNANIAWGFTNANTDNIDVFQETVVRDPSLPSGFSTLSRGTPEPIIPIPVEFRYIVIGDGVPDNPRVAGPVFELSRIVGIVPRRNNEADFSTGQALSVASTLVSGSQTIDGSRRLSLAHDVHEVHAASRYIDVTTNLVAADRQGNIGYFLTGELPLRENLEAGAPGTLPPGSVPAGRMVIYSEDHETNWTFDAVARPAAAKQP